MSATQDLQRAPPSRRGLNVLRRRNRPRAVDDETRVAERKGEWWRKVQRLWTPKVSRAGSKDVGASIIVANSNPRDDDVVSMIDDMHKEGARVGVCPPVSNHRFVRGEDTSTPSTQNKGSNAISHSNCGGDDVHSLTASVNNEDLRIAQHHEAPDSIAACEAPRPRIEGGEQSPILESTPQPIITSPPTPPPTLQTSVEDLNTRLQLPLNDTITAVFSGAQNIAIENVYITVGHGNATNLVAENVRWSMRENGTSFSSLSSTYIR